MATKSVTIKEGSQIALEFCNQSQSTIREIRLIFGDHQQESFKLLFSKNIRPAETSTTVWKFWTTCVVKPTLSIDCQASNSASIVESPQETANTWNFTMQASNFEKAPLTQLVLTFQENILQQVMACQVRCNNQEGEFQRVDLGDVFSNDPTPVLTPFVGMSPRKRSRVSSSS